jgi:hypothetical protein
MQPVSDDMRRYSLSMARPKTDADATRNLEPGDKTQVTPKGTKIGLFPRKKIMADFKKIVRGSRD